MIALLGGTHSVATADEQLASLKVGAETYTNVTVTSVTGTGICFTHSRGLGSAKLKDLEPPLQAHFGFDPQKAEATQAKQVQANALYRQSLLTASPQRPTPTTRTLRPAEPHSDADIPPHEIYAKAFLNQPAPELSVETWLTDQPELTGKFVLVDFWATWCGPCRRSIPQLNELYAKFKDRVIFIGLSDETEVAVRKMTNPKIEYAIAIDTQSRASKALEVRGIPHAILIDPAGIVRFEGMPHYLNEKNLEKLLATYSR